MDKLKYCQTFDEFLAQNPEIDPAWRDFMEATIQGADDKMFSFIMSYIFM